jgi:hypothetical protein
VVLVRFAKVFLIASVIMLSTGAAALVSTSTSLGGATLASAAGSGPQCTFNGSATPLVTGVSAGSKINVSCTGLPPLHPYLLVGTSLVLAIDPAAAPLFSGQVTSLSGLMGLLAALKEIDLASAATPTSNLSGDLTDSWTVPTFQAADPNASCPPTQKEFNSGLLGCALAMIDLTSFKPVGAGSALFEYKGFPVLPPNPTVALSTSTAVPNQTVSVGDAAAATTYWWLATLSTLEGSLGTGAGPAPTVAVTIVKANNQSVPAASTASVSSATYSGGVFTPPVLSGGFTVPSTVSGPVTVHVALSAPLDGIPLTITATAPIFVNNPPTTSVLIPSNGASEAGNQILDAAASDYGTLTKVEFHLTGGALNNALIATASPTLYGWLASWNSTTVPNGTYTVQSVAFDAGGLSTASAGVTIHVNNPLPTTSVLIPSANASVTGTQLLGAGASGGEPVQKVVFELTGGTLANTVIATATPTYYGWLANWNSTTVPNGTYSLQSVASYANGDSGTSAPLLVTVAN